MSANNGVAAPSCDASPEEIYASSRPPPRICGTALGSRAHVCAFFRGPLDEDRAILPFFREGLICGEKIVHTIDPRHRHDRLNRLLAAGIDFAAAHDKGRFDLYDWIETHLPGGTFDADRSLSFFAQIAERATRRGVPQTRFVTHMEWALEGGVSSSELLAYEAKANEIWLKNSGPVNPVICAYDLARFSGEFIIDVMRTHPMTLIDGILHENPFFLPPEEFIKELRARRAPPPIGKVPK